MTRQQRSSMALGLVLVALGGWLLATRLVPGLAQWADVSFTWPMIVMAVGAGLLFFGLLVGQPGMAVPACIVGGIGGLLYYQNTSGDWASWAYAWALIPGFVGVGVLLAALLEGKLRTEGREGLRLLVISAVLFLIFGSFLGGPAPLGQWWPVLLILLGLWMLFGRGRFRID